MQELDIKKLLQTLKKEAEDIFELFDSPLEGHSEKENLKVISGKYTYLKDKYKSFEKDLEIKNRENQLSFAEEAYLLPAINKLVLCASVPIGSMNKEKLSSCLYDFTDYLSHYIHEIKS